MGEVIYKIIKIFAAISLQILSLSLLIWVLNLNPHFSIKHITYFIFIALLVYLFISYSLLLFKQTFERKEKKISSEILDEEEIKHNEND